ncbi:hypothetical protein BLOT_005400 [Blomia tropicalis]|nr:hypothetical protein BLOT_005400 [Blomia tropicalis]
MKDEVYDDDDEVKTKRQTDCRHLLLVSFCDIIFQSEVTYIFFIICLSLNVLNKVNCIHCNLWLYLVFELDSGRCGYGQLQIECKENDALAQ